jgi:hypothetical protein
MDKESLQIIQEVLTMPPDEYPRIVGEIESGVIKADSPQTFDLLKKLSLEYDNKLYELRSSFLEAVLADRQSLSTAATEFLLAIQQLAEEHVKLLEPLELKFSRKALRQLKERLTEPILGGEEERVLLEKMAQEIEKLMKNIQTTDRRRKKKR